jgi:hypothetical protein
MLKIIKLLFILTISILLSNCGGTKYHYNFEKGKNIDFSQGKWILNKPYTNYNEGRIYSIAKKGFTDILQDSLLEIHDLRRDKLIGLQLPFDPTPEQLKDLKTGTNSDFLINISTNLLKDEMGSFASSSDFGSVVKSNEASTFIRIYDLNKMELISESSVYGIAIKTRTPEDGNWDYVSSGGTITMKGLARLIKKYDKYRTDD